MFSIPILRTALSRTVPSTRLAALSSKNALTPAIQEALKNVILPHSLRDVAKRPIQEPVEVVTPHGLPNLVEISRDQPLWCPAVHDAGEPLKCSCKYKKKYRKYKCKYKKAKKKLKKCKKKRKKCKCKLKKCKRKYKKCKCKKKKYKKKCKK